MQIMIYLVFYNILLDLNNNKKEDKKWQTDEDKEEHNENMIILSRWDRNNKRNIKKQ